ncbi:MAG: ABC transporter substrate-binding protein [Halolamina sp.]
MTDKQSADVNRRTLLSAAGTAAAAAVAGCTSDGGESTPTEGGMESTPTSTETPAQTDTDLPEPETRAGYLQRANRLAHNEAPWIFLNRQYSVYGKSADIEWEARTDERIDAYAVEPATDSGDDVTITLSQMDTGLDPHDHRETPTDIIVLHAYEGLLARDRQGSIIDMLATEYERIEPGRIRFTIRDGVSFHSGDSLTPEDVAFSINRIVDDEVGGLVSSQSDQLAGVTGAEVVDGERAVDVMSDGINPVVFSLFASYCDIVNKSWIESNDTSYINQNVDGTGPFVLESYESETEVVYNRNTDYWDEQAAVSTLTINSAGESSTRVNRLLSGESDIVVNVPPQEISRIRNNDGTSLSAVPSTRVLFNAMRYDAAPFDDVRFRRAMNYAVDLQSIVENVLQTFGDQTGQPTLEGFFGYNEELDPYPYDPDRAEQLIEESGYAGAELTLHTPVGRYLKDVEIAQAVASQVDELSNVSAEVRQRDFSALVGEITTGNIEDKPPWYLIGWGNATFDASQTIIPLITSDGALTTFKNDRLDELISQAQSMGSQQ